MVRIASERGERVRPAESPRHRQSKELVHRPLRAVAGSRQAVAASDHDAFGLVDCHRVRLSGRRASSSSATRAPRSAARARGFPPFDRYAVIPVARNVWQHVEGGNPAATARRFTPRAGCNSPRGGRRLRPPPVAETRPSARKPRSCNAGPSSPARLRAAAQSPARSRSRIVSWTSTLTSAASRVSVGSAVASATASA